ncbi:MAG: acetylxylan esterase [Clostridia bacterium]|jgi:hypothetical protein|nr:acetylxylan esterase [Clostridia bacterium]MDD3093249.1 acetylxylan esterase [Clostridia bacterium]MDD3971413.1 acetylxylan esterase [Clostridia bacterium]
MRKNISKPLIWLSVMLVILFVCMIFADLIQRDFNKVEVSEFYFDAGNGEILTYKLYKPVSATKDNKSPAVLLMHGYQNDKETNAAYSIELARRGIVALSIDEYGHGGTSLGIRERGYTQYKFPNMEKTISGPERYLVMMNFSNMDFHDEQYSKGLKDSSMGGRLAYEMLKQMDFVDVENLGITGHSMGTWSSWTVAADNPDHKCIVIQCGEVADTKYFDDSIKFNNVLMLQAKYDEFNYFRDYQNTVAGLEKTPLRYNTFALQDNPVEWNTTYGSFEDGTARRMELLITNHRLVTHNKNGMAASMDWFTEAFGITKTIDSYNQTYMIKEVLVLVAMLCAVFSILPLMILILKIPFFKAVAQQLPDRPSRIKNTRQWWKGAVITVLIAGLSYPFMTQLGHGLLPLPENIFKMTVGNGFVGWYLFLIIIMVITLNSTWKKSQKLGSGLDYYDLGLGCEKNPDKLSWSLLGKSSLVTLLMISFMYLLVTVTQSLFMLDFRFIWPFFKMFTLERFLQFLVYIPIFALFFLLNNAKIFGHMRQSRASEDTISSLLICWLKNAFVMIGGVFLMVLIEYIPFFLEIGPGADLLFSSTFGGPFMSLMILFIPQVIIFSFLCTFINKKTGHVYVSAFTVASLACWIVTGGSALF